MNAVVNYAGVNCLGRYWYGYINRYYASLVGYIIGYYASAGVSGSIGLECS